jgi:hypothetical protein
MSLEKQAFVQGVLVCLGIIKGGMDYETIVHAVGEDALVDEAKRVGSGSMGTINRLLQDWKTGQERKIDTALVLPAGLQRAILEFMDAEIGSARATAVFMGVSASGR